MEDKCVEIIIGDEENNSARISGDTLESSKSNVDLFNKIVNGNNESINMGEVEAEIKASEDQNEYIEEDQYNNMTPININQSDATSEDGKIEHKKFIISLLDEFLSHHAENEPNIPGTSDDTVSPQILPESARHIEQFLIGLTKALHAFGCPTHALEYHATEVGEFFPFLYLIFSTHPFHPHSFTQGS